LKKGGGRLVEFSSAKQCHRRIRLFLEPPKLYTFIGQVTEELSEGLSTQTYRIVSLGRNSSFELRMK